MAKYRRAAKVDSNQKEIVAQLRDIPGLSVQTGMDDLLVGFRGRTYWFEIKSVTGANGEVQPSAIKPSQRALVNSWRGHYAIVSSIEQMLNDIQAH